MFSKFDKAHAAAIATALLSWAGNAYGLPPGVQEAALAVIMWGFVYVVPNKT